jgi:hypothetical protein
MRQNVFITAILASMSPFTTAHADTLRTVALTGQPAPGTAGGVIYESFGTYDHPGKYVYGAPVLNDRASRVSGRPHWQRR